MTKKKILITGCSGYIGSHLCNILKDKYIVHGLDIVKPSFSIEVFKLTDIRYISQHISQNYDTVIHLAALVNVGKSHIDPVSYYETNVLGTINILKYIKAKNFIFASTGAAVGLSSVYGISKKAAEDCVAQMCNTYTIFRFYNVIGGVNPTNSDGLFFNLLKAAKTGKITIFGKNYNTPDGTCIRDYVHVLEICNSIEQAIEKPSCSIEHLGHGVGTSVLEIVKTFNRVNNLNIDIIYDQPRVGDLEMSVLTNPSIYMKQIYTLEDLLKI